METNSVVSLDLSEETRDWCAFSRPQGGGLTVGFGPFEAVDVPPPDGVAFYVNDFGLSSDKPWWIPAEVVTNVHLEMPQRKLPDLIWEEATAEDFAGIFSEIMDSLREGRLEKSVPVVTQRADAQGELPLIAASIATRASFQPPPYYCYAMSIETPQGRKGFAGGTPELLLSLRKARMYTMALAGTAQREDRDIFAVDEKEIREHEYVVGSLLSKLDDIGMVRRDFRKIMELERLVHFHTPIYVELYRNEDPSWLVKRLHPTPALGSLPRTDDTMAQLLAWREKLACPSHFGAPFGLWNEGHFHCAVAIRGVHWAEGQLMLPAGCGVIEESRLLNEWRELRLKRQSVQLTYGL